MVGHARVIFPTDEGVIFALVYALFVVYLMWRTWAHSRIVSWAKQQIGKAGNYTVTPTFWLNQWNLIVEQTDVVDVGEIRRKQLEWTGSISRDAETHPATIKSKQASAVASFLSFTSYGYPQVIDYEQGYKVKWLDVRYHHKKQFPFIAMAYLDHNYTIIDSFVGWSSDKRTQKKAENLTK